MYTGLREIRGDSTKGTAGVTELSPSSAIDLLSGLHEFLDAHFRDLHQARRSLGSNAPVFALEHGLSDGDLDSLKDSVRSAVAHGFGSRFWLHTWLPFVVYAAEVGYDYVGNDYWPPFAEMTPGWEHYGDRDRVRGWFRRFSADYGGAVPEGAFAESFTIIAWPITHAVLPVYLQRYLAQLLFDFRMGLTTRLLEQPEELGKQLAARASNYTERFRVFCTNTSLLGHVAVALLSGENEPTPYLSAPTLARIVEGLSEEQQARHWLKSARASASRVRGFRPSGSAGTAVTSAMRLPRATDPRLFLRCGDEWNAYAELPDLTTLCAGRPGVYNQLRASRASVNGGARAIPPSGLLYPGQEVRFARWPRSDQPFLQLERGDDETNQILSDQCVMTKGPWWLFRRHGGGLAIEVKGKFVRPGHQYVLIGAESLGIPAVPWCTETAIGARDVRAYEFMVPPHLSEREQAALLAAELAVVSHVSIRPVGIVASAWDGEGEAEWLAGEPAMLGIRSDFAPRRARIAVDGAVSFLQWTSGEPELLFSLEGVAVGTHELGVTLLGDGDRQMASGSLVVTVRDPQVRPEGAAVSEGIRLLATPTRPTLAELWDDRGVVTIDGPVGTEAEIRMALQDGRMEALAEFRRTAELPVGEDEWRAMAKSVRADLRFTDAYDAAESCVITVARDGVGFATLTCERGFQPLRWRFSRAHDGTVLATLVDRTDGGSTTLEFYDVEAPLTAVHMDPAEPFAVSPRGGLVSARAGDAVATTILPTNPNALFHMRSPQPVARWQSASVAEVLSLAAGHRRWMAADLPADAFAAYELQIVGDAIARSIGTLIGGSHWAALERKLVGAPEAADYLDDMQDAVGIATEHKALASTVAYSLYKWLKPEELLRGFHEVIAPHLTSHGITGKPAAPRFLLMLAGRPGYIADWEPGEASFFLDRVLKSPVLYRAARFAVLGTRALNDPEGVERSF